MWDVGAVRLLCVVFIESTWRHVCGEGDGFGSSYTAEDGAFESKNLFSKEAFSASSEKH